MALIVVDGFRVQTLCCTFWIIPCGLNLAVSVAELIDYYSQNENNESDI